MANLRVFTSSELIKLLESFDFLFKRQKGSHIVLQKFDDGKTVTVVVPKHKEIRIGTLKSIIRQSKLNSSIFEN